LGAKPGFERWTYWEKFDYWAVYLLMAVVGLSGLVLWFPNLFTRVLPGGTLNLAHAVHSGVALTSVGVLLFIHLFNTHLRPEKFPLDSSVFSGLVDESHLREARPEFLERMSREDRLDQLQRPTPPPLQRWLIRCGGYLLIALCLAVLAVVLLAKLGK
jgi:cytochrome b subunit of formate dehydrogenase